MEHLNKLEKELNKLVSDDDDYWLRNDAKFRAVEQTVNYEEFDRFVKTAHLKKINDKSKHEKLDSNSAQTRKVWNKISHRESGSGATDKNSKQTIRGNFSLWQGCESPSEKFDHLKRICKKSKKCRSSLEISGDALAEIPEFLSNQVEIVDSYDGIENILKILENLSQTQRFQLNLMFAKNSDNMNDDLDKLFAALQSKLSSEHQNLLENLKILWDHESNTK